MPQKPQSQTVDFPVKGIDRSVPFKRQIAGTTYDCLNVRAFDTEDRLRGGKRSGTIRAATTIVGPSTDRTVTGLFPINEARATPQSGAATIAYPIDDSFMDYAVASKGSLQGATAATRHEYIQSDSISAIAGVYQPWLGPNYSIAGTDTADNQNGTASNPKVLRVNKPIHNSSNISAETFAPNFASTGDVEVEIRAHTTITTTANDYGWGPTGTCTGIGPFIRGNIQRSRFVAAYLVPTAGNKCKLAIDEWNGPTRTNIALSAEFTLAGLTDYPTNRSDNLFIHLYDTSSTTVEAVVAWGLGAIAVTLSATSTLDQTNPMGGFVQVRYNAVGIGSFTSTTRDVRRLVMTRLAPAPVTPSMIVDSANPGAVAYYLPPQAVGVTRHNTSLAENTSVSWVESRDPTSPAAGDNESGTKPIWPAIYDAGNTLQAKTSNLSYSPAHCFITDAATLPASANRYGIDWRAPSTLANGYMGGPCFRISEDRRSYCIFRDWVVDLAADNISSRTTQYRSNTPAAKTVINGTVTGTVTFNADGEHSNIMFHLDSDVRWTDDGTYFRCYVNGLLRWEKAAAVCLSGGTPSGWRIGISISPNTAAATSGEIGRARIVPGETPGATQVAQVTGKVLVLSSRNIDLLELETKQITNVSVSAGPTGAIPMATSFNGAFYFVDGIVSRVVDVPSASVSDWLATAGTLPGNCRLIALYRGRIVLARQESSPADPTIYYMARTGDPNDWDFGADPQPTTPVAGNNGKVGQPSDAITALAVWEDDFLVFGCATSCYIMEGDPGYGGTVQLLTAETGIAGPRAFTFDHKGALYFVGASGLYRIAKGTREPELVSSRRLAFALDRINLDTNLIQLTFDAAKRHVHVWVTPMDGSVGSHWVYDAVADSFFRDEYPASFGPFSACNINGTSDELRRWIIGGSDGYLRRPSDTAMGDDDGETGEAAIDSWVEFGPFSLADGQVESMCTELGAEIGEHTTAPVTWHWFTGQSAQEVAEQDFGSEVVSGSWGGGSSVPNGFQDQVSLRERGGYHKLRIRQTSAVATWQLESISHFLSARSGRRLR